MSQLIKAWEVYRKNFNNSKQQNEFLYCIQEAQKIVLVEEENTNK